MDVTQTPCQNDSGYTSSSSPSVKRVLCFPSFESTPSTSRPKSRKRKSEPCENNLRKLSDIQEQERSPAPFDSFYDSGYNTYDSSNSFLRDTFEKISPVEISTDDLKISSSLEKCSLEESPHSAKKYKWDDEEITCEVKSCSAPGTPQRQDTERDHDHNLRKFYSLDLTPTKGTSVKIGTPERLEILYPKLIEVKSPSKIRNELKRRTKPARKRLFHCRDFVYIFTNIKKVDHVITNIFSYLSDTDLVNAAKVSKLWRKALELDIKAWKRYKTYLKNITVRKENIYEYKSPVDTNTVTPTFGRKQSSCVNMPEQCVMVRSPPVSPTRVNWAKFVKWGAGLSGTQRLTKCVACGRPAVMERGLAHCSGPNCGYLFCTRCLGGSRYGSTELSCRCTAGTPPHALADVSNIDTAPLYFSDKVLDHYDKKSVNVLTDCNDNTTQHRHSSSSSGDGSFNILQHTKEIQKAKRTLSTKKKTIEPGSPQKVKTYAAGSKQSKRNLRRL